MNSYPYTLKVGSIGSIFQKIQDTGVPSKFTTGHLKTLGFTSSNDQKLIGILKFIGFLDQSGIPTTYYAKYRIKKDAPSILATAIRKGYAELFALYPNAPDKDRESLHNFFTGQTSYGKKVVDSQLQTFKTLCGLANFTQDNAPDVALEIEDQIRKPAVQLNNSASIPININIGLEIPATDDPGVYDKFFEALKKHLLQ